MRKVWWETYVVMAIGLVDYISTVALMHHRVAIEANPILGYYLENGGIISFSGAKILLLFGPFFGFEVARRIWSKWGFSKWVRWSLRLAIVGYILCYFGGSWYVSHV